MLAVISPAKTLDFDSKEIKGAPTVPRFMGEAEKVNRSLRKKSRKALMELQGISKSLAYLNQERNQEWNAENHSKDVSRQAALAFRGDVYLGLCADQWSEENMDTARDKLLILSGLYGLLKPSDSILPYRLEMGTTLKVGRRDNLYQFWKDKIAAYFKENIKADRLIVNLASGEYFKAITTAGLSNPVLDIEFKDYSNGEYKIISFFAKKARGLMANFIVQNNLTDPEDLKHFDAEDYYYDEKSSSASHYVFLRDKRETKN